MGDPDGRKLRSSQSVVPGNVCEGTSGLPKAGKAFWHSQRVRKGEPPLQNLIPFSGSGKPMKVVILQAPRGNIVGMEYQKLLFYFLSIDM